MQLRYSQKIPEGKLKENTSKLSTHLVELSTDPLEIKEMGCDAAH